MNREKSFLKNTMIITIGRVCTKMLSFLLLPLYTGILTTKEYGTVDLLNTLISLLLPIITFQIEMAVFRELLDNRNNKEKKKEIISTGIYTVIIQCLIFSILFIIITPYIKNIYKIYLFINVIGAILSSLLLQIARGLGNNTKYAIGSFINAITAISLNIIFLVILNLRVKGMLLGTLLGNIACIVYLSISLKIYKYLSIKHYTKRTLKKLYKYSIPLVPNQISWWIFNTSDRVIVSIFLGLSATGLLAAANKFSVLYTTIYGIVNLSWIENISTHINDKDIKEYYNKMFNIILVLFSSITLLLISGMPYLYKILINKKFIVGYKLVPILLIASLFYVIVSLTAVLYTANRDTKSVAKTSIIAAIINLVSHLLLLKYIGLYAAAVSTLLSYSVMAINRITNASKKYFKINLPKNKTIYITIMILLTTISYYINNNYLNILSILLTIIFITNLNKKEIKTIIKLIAKKGV